MTDSQTTPNAEELEPWDEDGGVPEMPAPTPELLEIAYKAIEEGVLPEGVIARGDLGDKDATARAIQAKIKAGATFDDVFGTQKLPTWQDIAGEPVVLRSFHLNPSTIKPEKGKAPGPAVYAVCELVRADGTIELRQTGGGNVLMQLVKAWEHGWLPVRLKMVATATEGGNTVLRLEKVEG